MNDFAPGMCLELETVTVSKWFLWLDESNVFRSEFFCNESLIFEKISMNLKRNVKILIQLSVSWSASI